MKKVLMRQKMRNTLLILSLLAFPVTMNYLSPYVIIFGASQGILNGSLIIFGLLFLSSLIFGRLWCSWLCPAGALGEVCLRANDRRVTRKWVDYLKWGIWVVWLGLIVYLAVSVGEYRTVDFFLLTESGISVDEPAKYMIYFIVVGIFLILSLLVGRRAGCHSICWMAPFMILGRKIRNLFAWPAYRIKADSEKCIDCKKCTTNCPMSLDVNAMVNKNQMENVECILCAQCADHCPEGAIHFVFAAGK